LPHVIAAELVNYVLHPNHPKEQAALCANGFRDTTRIASGSPEMWRDIAAANSGPLSRALGAFIADLQTLQLAIESKDAAALQEFFVRAKERRDGWNSQTASSSPE
jgi:prephenate dehydrogenase